MSKFKPNTTLPKGGVLVKPFRKKIANWVELEYDATVKRFGIEFHRVKDGLGGRGDREDWVADLPSHSFAVHDYNWNDLQFGINYGSFEAAIRDQIQHGINSTMEAISESLQSIERMNIALARLQAARAAAMEK